MSKVQSPNQTELVAKTLGAIKRYLLHREPRLNTNLCTTEWSLNYRYHTDVSFLLKHIDDLEDQLAELNQALETYHAEVRS